MLAPSKTSVDHGTNSRYVYGCRCPPCREAGRAYQRAYYLAHRVPAHGTTREYLKAGCRCDDCCVAWEHHERERRPEVVKARYARKVLARQREKRDWLREIKLARGCADCGYDKSAVALQFDHLRDKTFSISSFWSCSKERLLAEIAKCEVVCANCHAIRTEARRRPGEMLRYPWTRRAAGKGNARR